MPQRTYIADLAPNQLVEGVYAIQNTQLGLTRNGKPYLKCLIADRTGRAPGRMWNASEELVKELPTDGFVILEGQSQPYQGEMQLIIQHISAHTPSTEELIDLLPSTTRDIPSMFAQLNRILESINSPSIRALLDEYLNDTDLMNKFQQAPAAQTLHHAFLGGLLEHTLNLLNLAEATLPLYPKINRDIVLTGIFLHDLGKCAELTWESGFGYSDDGLLVGHIARGLVWLNQKADKLAKSGSPLSTELLQVLEHIIISHHGQPEFGALKIPATPEALMVSLLDNVDAKLEMAVSAARSEANKNTDDLGGNFTEKIWALNTRLYKPDPLEHEISTEQATQQLKFADDNASSLKGGI